VGKRRGKGRTGNGNGLEKKKEEKVDGWKMDKARFATTIAFAAQRYA